MSKLLKFYNSHVNFTGRTLLEYKISPGIHHKIKTISRIVGNKKFFNALDMGCSGDSVLHYIRNIKRKNFLDLAFKPLEQYKSHKYYAPLNADISNIPYRDEQFDLITGLDVLEHVKDDDKAAEEISRVTKKNGILILTLPHRMKYYTNQDVMIGHFRRYEVDQIKKIFSSKGFIPLKVFPVYGQIMKVQFFQKVNPKRTESSISGIRDYYISNSLFRLFWDIFVHLFSKIMYFDSVLMPLKKIMNFGIIFKKK